jgi:hypothetical protein
MTFDTTPGDSPALMRVELIFVPGEDTNEEE